MNKAFLIGNLGQDPEVRTTQGGMTIANLSLATNESRKKGDTWEKYTEWHKVVVFGKLAENVGKFCEKGKTIGIVGRIQTEKWQDKEGKDRWTTKIIADEVQFLGGKSEDGGNRSGGNDAGGGNNGAAPDADDIPF